MVDIVIKKDGYKYGYQLWKIYLNEIVITDFIWSISEYEPGFFIKYINVNEKDNLNIIYIYCGGTNVAYVIDRNNVGSDVKYNLIISNN